MANITFQDHWAYKGTSSVSFDKDSGQPFCFAGYDNNNKVYYSYVVKLYTDNTILNPTLMVYHAGTDGTNANKWLAASFVPCQSDSTPDSSYLSAAISGNTRLRFGRTWNGSAWSGSASNPAYGQTSGVTIPRGYFFIYITRASGTTEQHSYSTIRVWTATANAPDLSSYTEGSKYTISYESGGGSGSMAAQTKYHDVDIQLTANSFRAPASTSVTRTITLKKNDGTTDVADTKTVKNTTPKVFNVWLATGGETYANQATYTKNESTTMNAVWKNGTTQNGKTTLGSASRSDNTSQIVLTAQISDELSFIYPLTKTISYTFLKWTENADGTGTSYDATSAYSFTANKTLYAQYDSTTNIPSVSLPSNITREGYTFKGWSKTQNGSLINSSSYTPTGTETIYAVWEGGDAIQKGMYIYDGQNWVKVVNHKVTQ